MPFLETGVFAAYAAVTTGMLFLGNVLVHLSRSVDFALSRGARFAICIIVCGLFVIIILSVGLLALVLPLVLSVFWLGLRQSRRIGSAEKLLTDFSPPVPWVNQFMVFLMPVCATVTYALFAAYDTPFPYWIIALTLSLAGALLLPLSIWKLHQLTHTKKNAA